MEELDVHEEDLAREMQERIDQYETLKASILAKAEEHAARCDRVIAQARIALKALLDSRNPPPERSNGWEDDTEPDKLTIKEMAMQVIASLEGGGKTQTILALINDRFGTNLSRESLSPQLSRLREAGRLVLRGRTWFPANTSALAGIPFPDDPPPSDDADEPW